MAGNQNDNLKKYQDLVKILISVVERQGNQVQMLVETVVANSNPRVAIKHDLLPVTPLSSIIDASGRQPITDDDAAQDIADLRPLRHKRV
jgi:hypothetical protein